MATKKCAALVVGAGPAGVAAMGNLLARQLGAIAWVDPSFESGRVHRKYREVPSNTKVGLFQSFATAVEPFQKITEATPKPNAFTRLAKLDQEQTCKLSYAADMVRALTEGLVKMEPVNACRGFVTAAKLDSTAPSDSQWSVSVQQHNAERPITIQTAHLVLCTGAHPTDMSLPIPDLDIARLNLDAVLKPSELAAFLPVDQAATVAVVGASHSAILALLNLVTLARESHPHLRVKWFTRHPLRYAEYMDGWILRDNTGLKGLAADFARAELEDDKLASSPAGQVVEKIDCGGGPARENAQYEAHLPRCSHIVHAVGFTRDPLPHLTKDGNPMSMEFDHNSGRFHETDGGSVIPGLFGAGIAFPERVVDPHGNAEYAVGFFKFMKFLKRVVPSWVS
ncbi:Uncharacterized protein PECH_006743 [Penicillium ucsense]|uniref:FAD-dependent urate hydroxylase HpyO/Asp monooxygenase CreE-like FAD/NAD(P)-binding domain-containing protein n=1 Tax=Penicillium ucsense TaxID=2839758 RepID=A0A8J8W2J2_9EURO|nr:Uncharacterized protein PECM_000446 [Penicillium ucsense]KAF7735331.1 Uncharacterized protein PECH_006743 [Penicillium ucsense]